MNTPTAVRLYCRVSNRERAVEGYSLDAQELRGRAYCAYKGWPDPIIYSEPGVTGRKKERPRLDDMVQDLREGDIVLVKALNRLDRGGLLQTLQQVATIREKGARLVSLDESFDTNTAVGRLLMEILASFAAYEWEQTRERSMNAKIDAAKMGYYPGRAPLGYTRENGKLIPKYDHTTDLVRRLYELKPTAGLNSLCVLLEDEGIPAPGGGRWHVQSVARLLANPIYRGEAHYRRTRDGENVIVTCPAIVTPDEWNAAQTNLPRGARDTSTFPLSTAVRCFECGGGLSGMRNRTGVTYYRCHTASNPRQHTRHGRTCSNRANLRAETLLDTAREELARAFEQPEILARFVERGTPVLDPHEEERARIDAQIKDLIEAMKLGAITPAELLEHRRPLEERRAKLAAPTPAPLGDLSRWTDLALAARSAPADRFAGLLERLRVRYVTTPDRGIQLVSLTLPRE